jgi:hypothetical protein
MIFFKPRKSFSNEKSLKSLKIKSLTDKQIQEN